MRTRSTLFRDGVIRQLQAGPNRDDPMTARAIADRLIELGDHEANVVSWQVTGVIHEHLLHVMTRHHAWQYTAAQRGRERSANRRRGYSVSGRMNFSDGWRLWATLCPITVELRFSYMYKQVNPELSGYGFFREAPGSGRRWAPWIKTMQKPGYQRRMAREMALWLCEAQACGLHERRQAS